MAGGTTAHHLSALQLLTLHLHKGKQWHENSASLYVVIFFFFSPVAFIGDPVSPLLGVLTRASISILEWSRIQVFTA